MAFPILLEIGLIVSIAGIMGLSLFILYLVDKLQTRVNSVERILKEMNVLKDEVSILLAEKSQSESQGPAQTGLSGEIIGIPNGQANEAPSIQKLEANIQTANQKLEALTSQLQTNIYKTNELNSDLQGMNKVMDNLEKTVADSNQRLNIVQADLSKVAKKLREIEEAITTIIRNTLQSKP